MTFGAPHFLSSATLRPLGPSVVTTALAKILTPRTSAWRASSENFICLAIDNSPLPRRNPPVGGRKRVKLYTITPQLLKYPSVQPASILRRRFLLHCRPIFYTSPFAQP